MKKDFTKYEQALDLRDLEFNEPCFSYFEVGGRFSDTPKESGDDIKCQGDCKFDNHQNQYLGDDESCSAPTYSQAFRWFREKYGLSGLIEIGTQEFSYQVFNYTGNKQLGTEPLKYNGTYEEAESACLDKLIEIVKNK